MEQRVRIRDIADELGLSTATVSNVIHGKTSRVSDETVRRVQALLEQRQYVPSMAGILLAQNDSRIIGVFINDHEKYEGHTLEDAFIASALNALSTEMEARGLFMMVKKAQKAEDIIRFASMWNMDGVVVIGFCQQDYAYLRDHTRLPFVVYDGGGYQAGRVVTLTLDDFGGGRQVGALFRRTGHESALCISDNDSGVDHQRLLGFGEGFGAERTEVLRVSLHRQERWETYRRSLPLFQRVTAVFAVSDYYAAEVLRFLRENGFRVPEDISVAGFDDTPLCRMVSPTLTTVRQDTALRARVALDKLAALKAGEDTPSEVTLPVQLVERESTRRGK